MKAPIGKLLIKVDTEQKNGYTFSNGTEIVMRRDIENLDKKYTQQTIGECIDSEYIPKGALILFHHNATHEVNMIFDSEYLTKEEQVNGFKIISIKESECFLWKEKGDKDWQPLRGFCTALRVFEVYKGNLVGIEPKLIKNVLYLTSGEYKGEVANVVKAADYEITFRNEQGKDEHLIRCRHFEDEDNEREELTCINHYLTERLLKGELMVGITAIDCKALKYQKHGSIKA